MKEERSLWFVFQEICVRILNVSLGVRHDNRLQEEVQIRCVFQAMAMNIQKSQAFWRIFQRKHKIKLKMWQLQMYWIFGNH